MNRARYREACELIRAMVAEQLARPAATLRRFSEQALTDAHTIGLNMETRLVCSEPVESGSSSLDTWLEQRIGVLLNYVFGCMPAESRTRANVERQARDVFLMTTPPFLVTTPPQAASAPAPPASGVRVFFQMRGKGLCLVRQTMIGAYLADTVVLAEISELNEKALRAYKLVGGTIDDTILGEP